jgi:hypothetical protein
MPTDPNATFYPALVRLEFRQQCHRRRAATLK